MTEEEIRIIVDRVFTELRNNSKTIGQLSEKTEVDNCWFEIDNGFKISLDTLKKRIAGVESINVAYLSDLDAYTPHTKKGVFNVYRNNIHLGIIFIFQFEATNHGGLQIFFSSYNFTDFSESSLKMPSIIYRRYDYSGTKKWDSWKPYQTTFISNDGSVPDDGAGIGLDATNMVPALKLFLEKTDYPKVVEWSGELLDGDITFEEESTINVIPSEIYFSTTKNCFCVKRSDKYYNSWLNKDDSSGINGADYFVQNKAFTKNVFKGLDGSVWIADSSTSIKLVSKALDVIDGEYHENNKEAFQPIADKLLASSNFLARILYYFSDDKTYELVFFNGCIPERSYGFSTVYPLMIVGVSSTGKIFMMHRYNKQIEIFKAQ